MQSGLLASSSLSLRCGNAMFATEAASKKGKKAPKLSKEEEAQAAEEAESKADMDNYDLKRDPFEKYGEPRILLDRAPNAFASTRFDVNALSESDIGKYFFISNDEFKAHFVEGVAGEILDEFTTLKQRGICLREPAWNAIERLRAVYEATTGNKISGSLAFPAASSFPPTPAPSTSSGPCPPSSGILLYGDRGVGKSACLNTAIHFARKNKFLVVVIPDTRFWTHSNTYIQRTPDMKLFEQPVEAFAFLQSFREANKEMLATLPLHKEYTLQAGVTAPVTAKTFLDVVNFGAKYPEQAALGLRIVLDELSQLTNIPVMIAVDGFNAFADITHFRYGRRRVEVPAEKLELVDSIVKMIRDPKPNRFIMASTTEKHYQRNPLVLSAYSNLDPSLVEPFSPREFKNVVDYYRCTRFYRPTKARSYDHAAARTGFNGRNLWRYVTVYTSSSEVLEQPSFLAPGL